MSAAPQGFFTRPCCGTLEINAVAFQDGNQAALLIAIDTLIAGPDLTTAAAALARDSFGDGAVALVAASHTHFAPATDPTRPMLGELTAAYAEGVHTALQQVVCARQESARQSRRPTDKLPTSSPSSAQGQTTLPSGVPGSASALPVSSSDEGEAGARGFEGELGPVTVLDIGGVNADREQTPIRVGQDVALATGDLLGGVIAPRTPL